MRCGKNRNTISNTYCNMGKIPLQSQKQVNVVTILCHLYSGKNLFSVSKVSFAENPQRILLNALIAAWRFR